jgi:PAS domain S-box-containing protein
MPNSKPNLTSDPGERPNPDGTARQQAEESARKERDLSAAVLETAGALIVVLDKQGRITRFNRACEALTGYSAAEVLGRVFWEFLVPPEDLRGVRQTWEALKARDLANEHENHWVAKDGSRRLIAWSNTAILTPQKEVDCIIATGLDMTERKRAEVALRQSEERLRLAQRHGDVGVWGWNVQTDELNFEPETEQLYGLVPGTMRTYADWTSRVHPDDLGRIEAERDAALARGAAFQVEFRTRHSSGEERWIAAKGRADYDPAGQMFRVLGINHDISRRKQAERELFEANQRLELLMHAVPVGVSFSDDVTWQCITGNPAVLAQFELDAADNLSTSAPDAVAPGRQVRFFREGRPVTDAKLPLQRAVAENTVIPPMELEVHLPSGRRWFTEASGAPVRGPHGEVIGGLAVTVDITAHKRARPAQ